MIWTQQNAAIHSLISHSKFMPKLVMEVLALSKCVRSHIYSTESLRD